MQQEKTLTPIYGRIIRAANIKASGRVYDQRVDAYLTFSQINVAKPMLPSIGEGAGRVV